MARKKSDHCNHPGCTEARMVNKGGKTLRMCEKHQREYWREQVKKYRKPPTAAAQDNPTPDPSPLRRTPPPTPPRKQRGERCRLCGRTAAEAAAWLLVGVRCECEREATRAVKEPHPRPLPVNGEGRKTVPALVIDGANATLATAQIVMEKAGALPEAIGLRKQILDAEKAGVLVLRKHIVTGVNHDQA